MSRARELAKLANTDAIGIDGVDVRTGSIAKGTQLDVASNVNVIGVITATNFIGNASGLTGLGAVGSGVTVLRANNSLGAITKLNFDSTFTVTDPASGLSTVTSGVTTADPRSASLVVAGISTLQNVTAGVATANQFSGNITGVAATFTSGITGIVTGATEAANAFGLLGTPNVTIGFNTATRLSSTDVTTTNINVTGVTTTGIVTVNNNLFSVNSTLSGITTITELNLLQDLEIAGFTTITNGGLDVVGVVTAVSGFSGPVIGISTGATEAANAFGLLGTPNVTVGQLVSSTNANLSGITSIAELNITTDAEIAGFSTISKGGYQTVGIVTSNGAIITGIVTAATHVNTGITTYYGDSSYSAALRWTLMASGSDHYVFTGPGLGHSTANDPALYLKRGQTYMFENKMGAHPFRIQSTTNGAAGTQWNVGVTNNDVANGVLIFEVPFVCPDTLYYQCTAHAAMGGVINIA